MSGYKQWRRLEEVTSDDLNGFVASQVIPRFPTTAARGTAIPTPEDGQAAWTPTTGVRYWSATLADWLPDLALPWPDPLHKMLTAQQGFQSGGANITDLSGTAMLYPGRIYRVHIAGRVYASGAAGGVVNVEGKANGVRVMLLPIACPIVDGFVPFAGTSGPFRVTAKGTKPIDVTGSVVQPATSGAVWGAAGQPSIMRLLDCGPDDGNVPTTL